MLRAGHTSGVECSRSPKFEYSEYSDEVDGCETYCLCTQMMQLQFYSLLNKTDSKLRDSIPSLVASGIVLPDVMDYKVRPWDGSGEFPVIYEAQSMGKKRQRDSLEFDKGRCRTKWSETEFLKVSIGKNDDVEKSELPESESCIGQSAEEEDPMFWPYIVHKRCDGSNLEHVCVSLLFLFFGALFLF